MADDQPEFQIAAARIQAFEELVERDLRPRMLSHLPNTTAQLKRSFEVVDLGRLGAETDGIISVTSFFAPVLLDRRVTGRTHIAAVGTDTRSEQEPDPALVALARTFTDEIGQPISIGECQHADHAGRIARDDIIEIGSVIIGDQFGHQAHAQGTLFDGTGRDCRTRLSPPLLSSWP
ncbi:hypothetical protein [Paracoccus sp. Ld10]|uniref:hypothetical protein n=1 Tax=Paracoccus sp. Ld10 TaxID=649158 RepID=UPI00386853CC